MHTDKDGEVHIEEQEASGGSKEGVVRWVLLISLLAAVLILSIVWIVGAMGENEIEESNTVTYSEE